MIFELLKNKDGYRADLPGSVLISAQTTEKTLPLGEESSGFYINLSKANWYDEHSVSGKNGGIYGDITKLRFEPNAMYSVFYFHKTTIPYILAIRIPS